MKILKSMFAVLMFASTVKSAVIYGPQNNSIDGLLQYPSLMSTFMVSEETNIYRITVLNQTRGTYTSGILHEFDDLGQIVQSYPMPFFAVTAPPVGTYVGLTNMYQGSFDITLKPHTIYGFQWKYTRPNGWYFTQSPMVPKEKNTGPVQIGTFKQTNLGFYPIPNNLIMRIYSR